MLKIIFFVFAQVAKVVSKKTCAKFLKQFVKNISMTMVSAFENQFSGILLFQNSSDSSFENHFHLFTSLVSFSLSTKKHFPTEYYNRQQLKTREHTPNYH